MTPNTEHSKLLSKALHVRLSKVIQKTILCSLKMFAEQRQTHQKIYNV